MVKNEQLLAEKELQRQGKVPPQGGKDPMEGERFDIPPGSGAFTGKNRNLFEALSRMQSTVEGGSFNPFAQEIVMPKPDEYIAGSLRSLRRIPRVGPSGTAAQGDIIRPEMLEKIKGALPMGMDPVQQDAWLNLYMKELGL
jgi:hypothetical protein